MIVPLYKNLEGRCRPKPRPDRATRIRATHPRGDSFSLNDRTINYINDNARCDDGGRVSSEPQEYCQSPSRTRKR
jgi:hypothetical protein